MAACRGADLKGVMEHMGHTQFQTTQKFKHTLPDTDQKNLDAFSRVADRRIQVIPAQNDALFSPPYPEQRARLGLSRPQRSRSRTDARHSGHPWMVRCV
jgi:hypothetical protein